MQTSDIRDLREAFQNSGVVLIRGLLTDTNFELLQLGLNFAEKNPSPMATDFCDSEEGIYFSDFLTFRRNESVRQLAFDGQLAQLYCDIVATKELRLFHDSIFIKYGDAPPTPWHQDRPHYVVEGEKNFSVWMTLDTVPANESLAFIPGSHRLGRIFSPRSFRSGVNIEGNETFEPLTEKELIRLSQHGILVFHVEPGDALLFDNRIIHAGLRGRETSRRRALSLRYIGDGARLTTNFLDPHPPLHEMGMKLVDGGEPSGVWFPRVI